MEAELTLTAVGRSGAAALVQVKMVAPWSQVLGGTGGDKWLRSGPVVKAERSGLTAGLGVQHKGMKEVKDDSFCHLNEWVSG